MLFLHCSDIHLGRKPVGAAGGDFSRKRFEDYFKAFSLVVNTAIGRKTDALLVAGDFFDKKELTPDVLARTEELLLKLKEHSIEVILIEGNHDNVSSGSETDSWIVYLQSRGLLNRPSCHFAEGAYHFNKVTIQDVEFYGLGYPGSMVNETLQALAEHLKETNNRKNVVLVHTAPGGGDFLPGLCSYASLDLFKDLAIYIAAGHFHKFITYPEINPYFFIPGSTEYWDFGETGQEKGMILFDTDKLNYEFIPSEPRNAIKESIVIEADNFNDFKAEFLDKVNVLDITRGEDVITIIVILTKSFFIDTAWCEEVLKEKGALKAFIKLIYPNQSGLLSANAELRGKEQIEKELIASWEYFSAFTEETSRILTSLQNFQKEKNQDQFIETFDTLLNKLLDLEKENEN